jgi:PPOX class probable F420-dependent enzyme
MPYQEAAAGWWQDFVSASPARTAKVAIVRADGSPHVSPVWVVLNGEPGAEHVLFTTHRSSAKARALQREPRVSICWDDERPPFAFVTLLGTVELLDDLDQVRHWATVIGGRYMGVDRADEYGARNGVPGEFLVRVTPTRVIAKVAVAD